MRLGMFGMNRMFDMRGMSSMRVGHGMDWLMARDAHITEENFEDYCALDEEASPYESGMRLSVDETMCGNGIRLVNDGEEAGMFTVHMDGAVQNAALSMAAAVTVLFNLF